MPLVESQRKASNPEVERDQSTTVEPSAETPSAELKRLRPAGRLEA